MRYQLLMISCLLLFATACTNQPQEKVEKATTQEEESDKLHLNNGQKWTVNDETHIGMSNIQVLLANKTDSLNYDSLATKMEQETQYIIKNCDMVGKDHDQLHLVLHPILTSIGEVKNGADEASRENGVAAIEKNLSDYFEHFQTK